MIAQSWGDIMAGASYSPDREHRRRYPAPGQCGFAFMFQVGLFTDADEGERELEFREHGIPVGSEHRRDLEDIAAEFGVDVPWPSGG